MKLSHILSTPDTSNSESAAPHAPTIYAPPLPLSLQAPMPAWLPSDTTIRSGRHLPVSPELEAKLLMLAPPPATAAPRAPAAASKTLLRNRKPLQAATAASRSRLHQRKRQSKSTAVPTTTSAPHCVYASATATQTVTASALPVASPKRKRTRKLSPKQLARWIEKEADDSQVYNLTLDVNDLKQQLQTLAMQQSILETRALVSRYTFSGAAMRTVDRFFQIFVDGFRVMQPEEQRFVTASTDEAVALGTAAYGRDVLLQQWERYTRIFGLHAFINGSMTIMTNDPECTIVRCDGKFDGRISRETVEIVFPHILSDEALVQRVLGCKVRIPVKTLLYFDATGCIVRYDAHVDVFEGLNDLLASNPRDVITMMAQAQINDASMIPDQVPAVDKTPVGVDDSCEIPRCPSPSSPSRFFPVDDDRHSVDYILCDNAV